MINKNIFNVEKTDYTKPSLFLGQEMGLFDTLNCHYPEIWAKYKKLKALDWDENEFDFKTCNMEFKTCSRNIYDMMILTLSWQWEADSIVAKTIVPVVAPFVTNTELAAAWGRIGDNENLHAATYSEIVKTSFDDPEEVFNNILKVKESLVRLDTIASAMNDTYIMSHKLALGLVDRDDQETYNSIFMFVVALYALERIQFIASFAVTFAIAESGLFIPIGKAVQKICQDEFEIHAELDRIVLIEEMKTERGRTAYNQCKDKIKNLLDEVVESEHSWVNFLFSEGRELAGVTPELLKACVCYYAEPVYKSLNIQPKVLAPKKNPLGYMDDWIVNDHQASPQEEKTGNYMLGGFVSEVGDSIIEIDL